MPIWNYKQSSSVILSYMKALPKRKGKTYELFEETGKSGYPEEIYTKGNANLLQL